MTARALSLPMAGLLAAVGVLLTYAEMPLPFVPPFMKIDLSDVPAVIGLYAMGLPAALLIAAVKCLLHLFVSESLGIGEICNFLVAMAYLSAFRACLPWSKRAGWAAAILSMTAAAAVLNAAVLLPLYFAAFRIDEAQLLAMTRAAGSPVTSLSDYLLMVVIPFNLIKGAAVAAVSGLLWKRLAPYFQ